MRRHLPAPLRLFNGAGLATLFTNFAMETSLIFLPLFAQELGASKFLVGVVGAASGIAYFASSSVFGRQADIRGRLLFIRLGLGLGAIGFATQALATSPLTLMLARALVGFCLGMSTAALVAYNFEAGGGMGRFVSLGALGWLLGSIVAIFLQSYQLLFLLSSASCGVAFAISLSMKELENRYSLEPATLRVVRRNLRVYFPFFLRHLGANMVWVILPLFMASLGASKAWIALLSGVNTGGQVVAMMFVERFKASRLFYLGFILSALVFLAYSRATSYLQLIPVQALLAVAWSTLYVGALLLLLRSNEERATSTGILFSAISISGAAGPLLGGLVAQLWGYSPLMYLAAGLSLAGLGAATVRAR